jgi:hypothetical protein
VRLREAGVRISAKSGSFGRAFRNEFAVVELQGGERYAVAVFTRAHDLHERQQEVDDAIGIVVRRAVDALRSRAPESGQPASAAGRSSFAGRRRPASRTDGLRGSWSGAAPNERRTRSAAGVP